MSTAWFGPVHGELFEPNYSWAGAPTNAGTRAASLSGLVDWNVGKQLVELAANKDRQVTLGGDTGVLEPIWSDDDMLRSFNGWYLIRQVTLSPQQVHSFGGAKAVIPVTIDAILLGERQPVIVRSSRELSDEFSLTGEEVLAAPFAVSAGVSGFGAEPGGTTLTREYDSQHGDEFFPAGTDSRDMQLRVANVGTLGSLVLPALDDSGTPPLWLSARGGDCRAYDVSEGRAVYGPSHPLAEPSDLIVENGLLRVWVGARGVVPYVNVAAFVDGFWAQTGCVVFADETTGPLLAGARLVRVTPDGVTCALRVPTLGEIFLTLRRGERMIRVTHGDTVTPTISATRRVGWMGVPPTVSGVGSATAVAGEFHAGVDATTVPSFQWPAAATQEAWSLRMAWIPPNDDGSQDFAALFSLVDADANVLASAYWDGDQNKVVVGVGVDTVESPVVSFGADEVVAVAAYFDTVNGLGVTVHTDNSGTVQAADASVVTPTSSAAIAALEFTSAALSDTDWGDGVWGDGTWGDAFAAAGTFDEIIVFAGRLTTTQAAALVTQAAQLADVPADPRPVWYAAFDAGPAPAALALSSGRRVESATDANGFSRFVAALETVSSSGTFGISRSDTSTVLAAGLARSGDDAASQHAQLAAQSAQETRIR